MSFNGSGTFVINSTGNPVVTGTTISSTWANALTADLATGLSTCVTKDGQTTTTAIVPFVSGINVTSTASSFYEVSSYTATLTGCTTSPTYTVVYTKIGNQVTLMFPSWAGTSNATTKTLTGMPAAIRPSGTYPVYGMISNVIDNTAAATTPGSFYIASSGVITMYPNTAGGNWTNSGTATGQNCCITYTLA